CSTARDYYLYSPDGRRRPLTTRSMLPLSGAIGKKSMPITSLSATLIRISGEISLALMLISYPSFFATLTLLCIKSPCRSNPWQEDIPLRLIADHPSARYDPLARPPVPGPPFPELL